MGKLRAEVVKTKVEFDRVKAGLGKYKSLLIWSLYSGGVFLILALGWVLFPPEQYWWRLVSNLFFVVLLLNLWVSYWLIRRVKLTQRNIGELRIKMLQLVREKACDCQRPCDCVSEIEKEVVEKAGLLNYVIQAEVEDGN